MAGVRVVMEIFRSAAGHFSGRVLPDGGRAPVPFSGILDLVRVLEELEPEAPSPGIDPPVIRPQDASAEE